MKDNDKKPQLVDNSKEAEKNLIEVEGNIIESLPIHSDHRSIKRNPSGLREVVKLPHGTLEIDHHSRYWTEFDWDIILAVFALAKIHGEEREFQGTKKDIADVLGLKYDGHVTREITNSMQELGAAIHYKGSFYDIKDKKYTVTGVTQLISYHFVTADEMKKERMSGRDVRKKSWISIGKVFWESLKNGYFKIIDFDVYKKLPRGISRRLYLFFEKRLGRTGEVKAFVLEDLIKFITCKETLTKKDVKNFKYRVLKNLDHLYEYTYSGTEVAVKKITRAVPIRQPRLFPRLKQRPLNDWEKEILEKVMKFCGRTDDYFKNTISKYIRRLGPEQVYAATKDTEYASANDKDKYLIHLLKITYGNGQPPPAKV